VSVGRSMMWALLCRGAIEIFDGSSFVSLSLSLSVCICLSLYVPLSVSVSLHASNLLALSDLDPPRSHIVSLSLGMSVSLYHAPMSPLVVPSPIHHELKKGD
jgi:hypothetical protein